MRAARLAIVGAGPTGTALLERLVANVRDVAPDLTLDIHVIDPHPAGRGRVWRPDVAPQLWMNSMAEDVTMFTDESVTCRGPIVSGPTLFEWAQTVTYQELDNPDVAAELAALSPMSFPSRRVQSEYLQWTYRRILASLPPAVQVVEHRASVCDLRTDSQSQRVIMDDETAVDVDVVVLACGHLDAAPSSNEEPLALFARRHGARYVPPSHTADLVLQDLAAHEPVIVRGFGLAFIDLMILLSEGRGGRFDATDTEMTYVPSGREPVMYVGSRRGVPYRSKITYRLQAARAPVPRFFDAAAIDRLVESHERLEFWPHVWPLLVKDVAWAYYYELFHAHAERTTCSWEVVDALFGQYDWGDAPLGDMIADAVPSADDRFDPLTWNDPLTFLSGGGTLDQRITRVITDDRRRRSDPHFSADLGAFYGLLVGFAQMGRVLASGRLSARSLVEDVNGWWLNFFSYMASGPPPQRLDQLLALHAAGVVQFVGPQMWVETDETTGLFRAGSPQGDREVTARTLIDAQIAAPSVSRSMSPLLGRLLARGEIQEQQLDDGEFRASTGKLLVDRAMRVVDGDGRSCQSRFAVGIGTSRPAAGTFARPHTNALSFRQNDDVARTILSDVASLSSRLRGTDGGHSS